MAAPAATPHAARAMGNAIADSVQRVMPSVVVIRTEAMRYRIAQDWYLGRMFRIPERLAGQGSGVIITKDGYVLTNSHVIDEAQHIEVVLNDETKYPARLVGKDPHTDLAVIQIVTEDKREFTPVALGDSDQLRVGEFVVALGSPFSLSSSVTLGIVSQKGRAIGALPYEDFIQTDAAVNRGNSGGPLVDVDGRMVGINTMIQTAGLSQGNIGISFAVPVNLAMTVAQSLISKGKWERPWLGVAMSNSTNGVVIEHIVANSPAHQGGLKRGDIIMTVDGVAVATARDVQRAVLTRSVGDTVALNVRRDEKDIRFTIPTTAMPAQVFMPDEDEEQ